MSYYTEEEILLESNIRFKEIELKRMIADGMVQYLNGRIGSEPRESYCDHFHLSLPNYYFSHAEFSKSVQYGLQITENNHSRNVMEHSGLIMPENALQLYENHQLNQNNSHSTIRKYKRNTKKTYQGNNLYTSYNSAYYKSDSTEKAIDITEIGLGPQFNIKSESSLLITKFHRLYYYLTALCNERIVLESIILSTDFKKIGKYMLSTDNDIMGHFDYTRQSLSIEIDMIESLLNYIQEKCNDATQPFIKLCRNIISDILITIKILNTFDRTVLLRKPINFGGFSKLETILSNLIKQSRYLSINYTLLAQKLLVKEGNTDGNRRTIYVGR